MSLLVDQFTNFYISFHLYLVQIWDILNRKDTADWEQKFIMINYLEKIQYYNSLVCFNWHVVGVIIHVKTLYAMLFKGWEIFFLCS